MFGFKKCILNDSSHGDTTTHKSTTSLAEFPNKWDAVVKSSLSTVSKTHSTHGQGTIPCFPFMLSCLGLPWWFRGQSACLQCRDLGLIPGLGRSPRGWHGNPIQYSWRIPMDRGAWRATYSPWGLQRVGHDCATKHSTHTYFVKKQDFIRFK